MSETARILQFPRTRAAFVLSPEEISAAAKMYLDGGGSDQTGELKDSCLANPDVLVSIFAELRNRRETCPEFVADVAREIYKAVFLKASALGLFDERHYFLGEAALIAASVVRVLGRRDEAELWLSRAESAFHLTVNPAPSLAQVSYTRLAIRYEMGRYDEVLDLLPSLATTFRRLGMERDFCKAKLFEAMALKQVDRRGEAASVLQSLLGDVSIRAEKSLYGRALVDLGDVHQQNGDFQAALDVYQQALPLLRESNENIALADLQMVVGATLRNAGRVLEAVSALREAKNKFAALGMKTKVAYLSILASESLLALDRPREAEWEILQALPTIEEQKMVPEGFAAVALLRESVKRRKADPNALRELREHLQKQN